MSEREDGWRLETLAEAIADGFSNGNEQFNEASTAQQSRYIEAARAILALSAAPSPVDGGEELGGMIRQSALLSNEHTEAEPAAASDLAQLLRAFDKIACAVGPPMVRSEAGLHRGTDRLLVVRAHRWKTFAETAAKIAERHRKRVSASPLPLRARSQPCAEAGAHIPLSPQVLRLLRASSDGYWESLSEVIEAACQQVRHARLLNHQAAHILAWANLARDAVTDALRSDLNLASPLPLPEPGEGKAAVADSAARRDHSLPATNSLQVGKED